MARASQDPVAAADVAEASLALEDVPWEVCNDCEVREADEDCDACEVSDACEVDEACEMDEASGPALGRYAESALLGFDEPGTALFLR